MISDIPSWAGVDRQKLPRQVSYVGPLYGKLKTEIPAEVFEFKQNATEEAHQPGVACVFSFCLIYDF